MLPLVVLNEKLVLDPGLETPILGHDLEALDLTWP